MDFRGVDILKNVLSLAFIFRATHNLYMLVNKHLKQDIPAESTTEQLSKVGYLSRCISY